MPTEEPTFGRKTALIYDRLDGYGGGERVLEQMIGLYPRSDVFASIDILSAADRAFLQGKEPVTTFAQRWRLFASAIGNSCCC